MVVHSYLCILGLCTLLVSSECVCGFVPDCVCLCSAFTLVSLELCFMYLSLCILMRISECLSTFVFGCVCKWESSYYVCDLCLGLCTSAGV